MTFRKGYLYLLLALSLLICACQPIIAPVKAADRRV